MKVCSSGARGFEVQNILCCEDTAVCYVEVAGGACDGGALIYVRAAPRCSDFERAPLTNQPFLCVRTMSGRGSDKAGDFKFEPAGADSPTNGTSRRLSTVRDKDKVGVHPTHTRAHAHTHTHTHTHTRTHTHTHTATQFVLVALFKSNTMYIFSHQ
jgi:hypothetical protein